MNFFGQFVVKITIAFFRYKQGTRKTGICWIQWWCYLFLFYTGNALSWQIATKLHNCLYKVKFEYRKIKTRKNSVFGRSSRSGSFFLFWIGNTFFEKIELELSNPFWFLFTCLIYLCPVFVSVKGTCCRASCW